MQAVENEIAHHHRGNLHAISSAASGGDILFLEACNDLDLPAEIYLAKNRDEFVQASVADAGDQWIDRFNALCSRFPVHVPGDSVIDGLNVWEHANLWMLESALGADNDGATLLALWNGAAGDGDGGTLDMIERARDAGIRVVRIEMPNTG